MKGVIPAKIANEPSIGTDHGQDSPTQGFMDLGGAVLRRTEDQVGPGWIGFPTGQVRSKKGRAKVRNPRVLPSGWGEVGAVDGW